MHGCSRSRLPLSNKEYWAPKIKRNVERDAENIAKLQSLGWKVIVIWECELKKTLLNNTLTKLCAEIRER